MSSRRFSRRRLLTALPGLALLATGVACGGDDEDDDAPTDETPSAAGTASPSASASASASPGEAPAGGFPVTITHALGETTIPEEPTRVVAVNEGDALDHLLAVGIMPVLYGQTPGYSGLGEPAPWAVEAGLDVSVSYEMARGEPDLERMTAANPDLIVGSWLPAEQYEVMAKIAPTISIKDHDSVDWYTMQRMVGEATGRVAEAEEALAETDRVIEEQAARLEGYTDRTVMIGYQFFEELYIHGTNTPIARLVDRLGLQVIGPDPNDLTILSLERIDALQDADLLLSPWFFAEEQASFEANPLFQTIPAVQEGRYVPLPLAVAEAGYLESTLSVRWVIPKIADALIQAAEGEGVKPA